MIPSKAVVDESQNGHERAELISHRDTGTQRHPTLCVSVPLWLFISVFAALSVFSTTARAQSPSGAAPVTETTVSDRRELTNSRKDVHFIGHVEMKLENTDIYAEDVQYYSEGNRAIATGNVTFAQGDNRLSAERAEFNTETRLGTFYNAWGMAKIQQPQQRPAAGGVAPPPVTGEQLYVYFFGEKIEKIGPKKYKITNGGFSTCVQPTPRWNLQAGTVILNIDHYTLLKQAVFTVKGVPMFYVPILYYPTKREDRATGFLLPTYGSSTQRGQMLHNAFFWAINRSQDATFTHDWFSKTGQGYGSEYRYNFGRGSDGDIRMHLLDEHAATYVLDNGTPTTSPATRSYQIIGGANQTLPFNLHARANANYASDLTARQSYNTNIINNSSNVRNFGGNIVGAWRNYSLNATVDYNETFYNRTDSIISGRWPRVTFSRNERPLLGDQLYFSIGTDVGHLQSTRRTSSANGIAENDDSVTRFDVSPQIRYPFKKWQWFTANSTLSWRDTYYTRSYAPGADPFTQSGAIVDEGLNRKFFTLQSQLLGPVFNKVWNTPGSAYAEKFKHTVEPYLTIQRTSFVENFNRIVRTTGDSEVGGTQYTYGTGTAGWARDTRDSLITTTAGTFQRLGGEISGGDLQFYRLGYSHQWYYPLTRTYTLHLGGDLGYASGYGEKPLPFFKNYFAGGPGSVRGYRSFSLGPLDENGNATGANRKLTGTAEFLFPMPGADQDKSLRLAAFLDGGQVFANKIDLGELRYATGIALFWSSPLGPLRLSWAHPLNDKPGDRKQQLQFTFGTGF